MLPPDSPIFLAAFIIPILLLPMAKKTKINRTKWLWFCALLIGIFIAICSVRYSEKFLAMSEVNCIRWYITKWQPSSLDQFFNLFLWNLLLVFLGGRIMILGLRWLDLYVAADQKAAAQRKNEGTATLGGPLAFLPTLMLFFLLLFGPFLLGFSGLYLGLAGTVRLLYSLTEVLGTLISSLVITALTITYALIRYQRYRARVNKRKRIREQSQHQTLSPRHGTR